MPRVWDVPVRDSTRVRDARVAAEAAAALAGLDERRTAAAALVATELATNLLKHAEGGQVLIDVVAPPVLREDREGSRAVQIAAIDHGPGIADVPAALRDGFSTGRSLGAGLGTCLRLSDDFALHSVPGRGTVAVARVSMASRGSKASARYEEGVFVGGQWPGGEPPFGAVACGGLTGHPAVSGGAPGSAGRAGAATDGPAHTTGRAQDAGRGLPEAPSHALADTGIRDTDASSRTAPAPGTPATDPASRNAPGDEPADAVTSRDAAGPLSRPAGALPDPAAAPRHRSVPVAGVRAGGVNIPYDGAEYSGDAWGWVRAGDRVTLMLTDGLGHGPEAARASSGAVAALHRWSHLSPAELLGRLHDALKGTRGAAVALAQLDLSAGRLRFAGIGNVGARLHSGGTWRALLSRPGIVGVHRPATLREEGADWTDESLLILHTDGLPSRWTPPSGPGLAAADPAVTAAVTIRDASSPARPVRDDTAVAVLTSTPPERP
ncbi:SpoIIE family protein phosphatase [Streptomyces luteogriseus]|uniref:SpoIIE family protein phosphatase n=1 Tax=Streptomyces luteogriseus TaxID=68233 RepID=UPI00379DDFA3